MKITKEKIWNKIRLLLGIYSRKSYAQCGEDLVLAGLLNSLNIKKPYYVDIGAHHPKYLSNTYFFYKRGSNGVCIEPDPVLFKRIKKIRKRDKCLNIGIGEAKAEFAKFYLMSVPTLNTFSKSEAESYVAQGTFKIKNIINVPVFSINEIFASHVNKIPDLVSIDVEGLDYEILKSIDFNRYRPKIFCIETLTYDKNFKEQKVPEISEFMQSSGYMIVADTWLNTIFADKELWNSRSLLNS